MASLGIGKQQLQPNREPPSTEGVKSSAGRAASRARTAHGRVRRRHGWPSALHREPTQLQSRRCRASGNSCRPVETGRSCAFSKRKT